MSTTWSTWSGGERCTPTHRAHPGSTAEVVAEVARAVADRRPVRVAGSGHSFTPAVLTEGVLLQLDGMSQVLDLDRDSGLVRVQAGITLGALSDVLWTHGLALENLGDIDVQSVAGATATGTHGTGARLRNLSASLTAVELVDGRGDVHELTGADADGGDAWRAARVSLGALGVVTAVTLQTVPAFALRGHDAVQPREQVLDELDARAAAHDHFELFAFPYAQDVITRTNDRTDDAPRSRPAAVAWGEDVLLKNHVFEAVCRLGRVRPTLIPRLNALVTRAGASAPRTDRSYRIFATPRRVRFEEMEYAIPREHCATAVREVLAHIEDRGLAVPFPLEVRTVAPDDALLSPACGRDTAYIATHMYRGMAWEPLFRDVEAILRAYGGRPHWGKRHFREAADLAPAYNGWDAFQAVRDRLDPSRTFANAHVTQTLGA